MNRSSIWIAAMILSTMFAAGGCGSATKFTRDLVISSEPSGAQVYIDGDKIGETPLKLQTFFTWNKEEPYNSLLRRVVQIQKNGYVPQTRDLYPIDTPNIIFFLEPARIAGESQGGAK